MKAKLFITVLCLSAIFFLNAQIKVTSTGKVGIGTTNPSISNNVTVEGDSVLFRAKSNTEHGFLLQRCSFDQVVDFSPIAHNSNNWEYDLGMEFPFDWFHSIYEYIENSYIDYGSVNTLDVYNFYNYSDKRLKKNIKTMSFDKDLFSKLNPVSFDISDSLLITDKELKAGKKPSTTHQYGFLAQELQTLYPQLVSTDKKTAYLKVKPLELLPILVSAIQDLQAKTDAQAKQIAELINNPTSEPKKVSANPNPGIIETNALTYPVLDQNTPNPFNQSTTIGYYLPTTITNATIYVYDMNGVQLKSYIISERGKKNIIINGSEFSAGMYLYALIADSKVIDTKRMILTK